MSSGVDAARPRSARRIPVYRTIPRLIRDPLGGLQAIAKETGGEIVRLNLGLFRPYLVTDPEHVHQVLRDHAGTFVREGMFWTPLERLLGGAILTDGPAWEWSRRTLQPMLTAKRIDALMDRMSDAVEQAVAGLDQFARSGEPFDVSTEMGRIVNQTVIRVFFADRVSVIEADRIIPALHDIAKAFVFRMVLPWVPNAVPMPGDRVFRRGAQIIDEVLLPAIDRFRREPDDGDDIIATLCRSRDSEGRALTEQQIRDDVVTMFVAATETTSLALTWLWPNLGAQPAVAVRLCEEVDRVVGGGPVQRSHLPDLHYLRAVLDELVRLYPTGWILPRKAAQSADVGGVRIPAGATVLISPFLTQRMDMYWDRPGVFDPDRFLPERSAERHRYAYFPFGGGPHQCIGKHLFQVEAQLIVATMLTRFRPGPALSDVPPPQVAATLLPERRVQMTLRPVQRRLAA
ncbi:cytochrome P450 [Phytohabitans rumicis]|uniref:Cytochrome P450 n=1 Tax=Phytohabitans rumicis TaxID=1076125 RepID=A0A6V8L6T2_9ACTN|nr:cytochrome P450 [Phytohabitans rumicis]GFJ91964.1 cytochrome P450 [Phytohabitans rumicis]